MEQGPDLSQHYCCCYHPEMEGIFFLLPLCSPGALHPALEVLLQISSGPDEKASPPCCQNIPDTWHKASQEHRKRVQETSYSDTFYEAAENQATKTDKYAPQNLTLSTSQGNSTHPDKSLRSIILRLSWSLLCTWRWWAWMLSPNKRRSPRGWVKSDAFGTGDLSGFSLNSWHSLHKIQLLTFRNYRSLCNERNTRNLGHNYDRKRADLLTGSSSLTFCSDLKIHPHPQ